jgi:hypothetical protein
MQRHGQLDDAEAGPEMAAGDGDGADGFLPEFVGELLEVGRRKAAQILRR